MLDALGEMIVAISRFLSVSMRNRQSGRNNDAVDKDSEDKNSEVSLHKD